MKVQVLSWARFRARRSGPGASPLSRLIGAFTPSRNRSLCDTSLRGSFRRFAPVLRARRSGPEVASFFLHDLISHFAISSL